MRELTYSLYTILADLSMDFLDELQHKIKMISAHAEDLRYYHYSMIFFVPQGQLENSCKNYKRK